MPELPESVPRVLFGVAIGLAVVGSLGIIFGGGPGIILGSLLVLAGAGVGLKIGLDLWKATE